jgi:hypothetical protein
LGVSDFPENLAPLKSETFSIWSNFEKMFFDWLDVLDVSDFKDWLDDLDWSDFPDKLKGLDWSDPEKKLQMMKKKAAAKLQEKRASLKWMKYSRILYFVYIIAKMFNG